jgi:serine phosphatase RsbU (regulator of sigma subunit)
MVTRWFGIGFDIDDQRRATLERERILQLSANAGEAFQQAALPAQLPDVPSFAFHAVYEAGRADALVGGDWYDAFALLDGRIVISIGDVAGSGLQAAVTMAKVRQTIRGVAQVHADPTLILRAADGALRSEKPDLFVTAFVGVMNPGSGTLTFASAGHPAPYLRDADGRLTAVRARGLPLGLRERDDVPTRIAVLRQGALLVLYTDGLIESTRDIDEGEARLRDALANPAVVFAADPARAIRDAVLLDGPARDDVAILTVRVI